jgi:phage terminase small subunit
MKPQKLTPKQSLFVREYLIDLNATQAAIRAGYSPKTAQEQSSRLLSNVMVQQGIQQGMDARAKRNDITSDRVLKEIARLAFFDPRKLLNADGTPKSIHELDDDTAAAVAGIDIVTRGNEDLGYADIMKVKLADKSKNLELLGRHLKLFTDKIEVDVSDSLADRIKEARERAKQG